MKKNTKHMRRHHIEIGEVKEVISSGVKVKSSYRKRLLIIGKTKSGRRLAIVMSPEDGRLQPYEPGVYYPITAFDYKE
jgi:uncharacterized DUF497 family protein